MSLKDWLDNRWIEAHQPSREEMQDLLSVVDRDLKDARVPGLSPDAKGNLAYNAMLQLATLAMYAEGYRPGKTRGHERTILSLEYTIRAEQVVVDFLDTTRRKRNNANYGRAGVTSAKEAAEMIKAATDLRASVVGWMKKKHRGVL